MARIAETHEVLDGRGTIYRHDGEQRWRYREYDQQKRKYRTGLITDARTLTEAKEKVIELVLKWTNTQPQLKPRTAPKKSELTIAEECQVWLKRREEQQMLNDPEGDVNRIKNAMKLMVEYLDTKKVKYAKQLKVDTFDDYLLFRKGKRKLTWKTELQHIKSFLVHHLRRKGLITNELAAEPEITPKVKITDADLDANPSVSRRDYEVINLFIRGEWRDRHKHESQLYFKRYFHTYIHLLWNSGCRPGELLKLRMKDITLTNKPRYSESQEKVVDDHKLTIFIRKSKTGKQRHVPLTSNAADNLISFLKYQKRYLRNSLVTPKPESLLFGKPEHHFERTYSYPYIESVWANIIKELNDDGYLEGNKFSDRNVTIYSLRSSWIENMITKGTDVYLIAKLAGNSVAIIQKYYDRHDVLKRAEEIQHIQRGKIGFKAKEKTLDVLDL